MRPLILAIVWIFLGVPASAQTAFRHNFKFGAAGVIPVSGYRTTEYSAGPGWRGGYEFRILKHLGAEAGFTEGLLIGEDTCNRFGCTYSRQSLKFLDYGLRGVVPLAGGKLELSIGLGGGYVWHQYGFGGPFGPNFAMFQYSGKAALRLDRRGRFRLSVGVRT